MKSFRDVGRELALEAGEIMRSNFVLGMEKEWKHDDTPLTLSDKAINSLVIKTIEKEFPTHSILGEEESKIKKSEYTWVCDPIDGTIPFSHGVPLFTFSLALTQDGAPILGVLYDPILDRLVIAEKGKGAYLHDKKISVSDLKTLQNAIMLVDGSRSKLVKTYLARQEFVEKGARPFSILSFAYAGMLVAAGELVAAILPYKNPWDVAAVKIIVEEAGGKCTDIDGNEQRYDKEINGFIASNGVLHEEILKTIAKHRIKTS